MNTCDGCKHWRNPWDFDHGDPLPTEVADGDGPRWGTCELITLQEHRSRLRDAPAIDVPAFTRDGSDYRADLHTRADFGCTLWAPKEATRG